jgi:glycosyltransferase involved in cell wall biosynthesis
MPSIQMSRQLWKPVITPNYGADSAFMVIAGNWQNGDLVIPTFIKSQTESLRNEGWKVFLGIVDVRTSVRGVLRNIRRLTKAVAKTKPGLVHAQYGSVTAAVARLIKGPLPLVVSFCGDDLLGSPNPGVTWRVREKCAREIGLWAAGRAAAIIVKSRNLLEALPPNLKANASVLPNGVDTSWFRPMNRDECRARLGWETKAKVVLFNASINDNQNCKNPALARATVDILARSTANVSLHMLSNASQEEVRLIMNAADCLLMTSLHEGSPNIVKEAMSCGLPVVSVPCGDVAERLKATHPGGVYSYDAAALAKGIQEIFRTGCRSNGHEQIVSQGLTTVKMAERLIGIYRRIQRKCSPMAKERT